MLCWLISPKDGQKWRREEASQLWPPQVHEFHHKPADMYHILKYGHGASGPCWYYRVHASAATLRALYDATLRRIFCSSKWRDVTSAQPMLSASAGFCPPWAVAVGRRPRRHADPRDDSTPPQPATRRSPLDNSAPSAYGSRSRRWSGRPLCRGAIRGRTGRDWAP